MKNRFTRENNMVVDNEHGLMWQDDESVNNRIDWEEANKMTGKFKLGNYDDWRLPSIDELLSIANKNNAPNLDKIFLNRPFTTWSSVEYKDKRFIYAVFYDEINIVALINTDAMHKTEELFVRYVRDIKKINKSGYSTNIDKLTCTCEDWQLLRSKFSINDPRILCRHLLSKLDINNIDSNLSRYKQNIVFYKDKDKGFLDDFNALMDIEGTTYKLLYKYDYEWMSFFDADGTKYGVMLNQYNNIAWTNLYGKPLDYEKVEKFLMSLPKVVKVYDSYED